MLQNEIYVIFRKQKHNLEVNELYQPTSKISVESGVSDLLLILFAISVWVSNIDSFRFEKSLLFSVSFDNGGLWSAI